MEEGVRWNIKVSKETDLTLRTFLGSQGMKKGDLSKFIEEAVKWRLFDQTVSEVREAFADVPPDKLQKMIDRAVSEVRKEMRQERQSPTER
jgi:ribbon-helix-helix protein